MRTFARSPARDERGKSRDRHREADVDRKRSRSKEPAVEDDDHAKRQKIEENGIQVPSEVWS